MTSEPCKTNTEINLCMKCKRRDSIAMCYGCKEVFCTRHFIKHRVDLSQKMESLNGKKGNLEKDLTGYQYVHPFLSMVHDWERRSIRRIQEIAEKTRNDLEEWINKTKVHINTSLSQLNRELESNKKSDNFIEMDLERWNQNLDGLRKLLEKPSNAFIEIDQTPDSAIYTIKFIEKNDFDLSPDKNLSLSRKSIALIHEYFVKIFGPCVLSERNCVVTHTNNNSGLSQISGVNLYSHGKHSINFLIEEKAKKNLFLGIMSSSNEIQSAALDNSVHGWWSFNQVIANGECNMNDNNETFQTNDRITLIIDCDNQKIELMHHRTQTILSLSIRQETCPFPWKLLVRLLSARDSLRILH